MKKHVLSLFLLLTSSVLSAQPLCVVWVGEPADKCDKQKSTTPSPTVSPQSTNNPLGVEWAGKPTGATQQSSTTAGRPVETDGGRGNNRNAGTIQPAKGNALDMEWAGSNRSTVTKPNTGNGIDVEWVNGSSSQRNNNRGDVQEGRSNPAGNGNAGNNSQPVGNDNGRQTTAGDSGRRAAPVCNVGEYDARLDRNRSDADYAKSQFNFYLTKGSNASRNGYACFDCYSQQQFYSGEIGRLSRDRELLLQQKQQCIAANSRAGANR